MGSDQDYTRGWRESGQGHRCQSPDHECRSHVPRRHTLHDKQGVQDPDGHPPHPESSRPVAQDFHHRRSPTRKPHRLAKTNRLEIRIVENPPTSPPLNLVFGNSVGHLQPQCDQLRRAERLGRFGESPTLAWPTVRNRPMHPRLKNLPRAPLRVETREKKSFLRLRICWIERMSFCLRQNGCSLVEQCINLGFSESQLTSSNLLKE